MLSIIKYNSFLRSDEILLKIWQKLVFNKHSLLIENLQNLVPSLHRTKQNGKMVFKYEIYNLSKQNYIKKMTLVVTI